MTKNEAIEVLKNFDKQVTAKANGAYQSTIGEMACKVAITALEEIQQYRALGTVEEIKPYLRLAEKLNVCDLVRENASVNNKLRFMEIELQEARKRQIPMKMKGSCPDCGTPIKRCYFNCPGCGQAIDWSEEE